MGRFCNATCGGIILAYKNNEDNKKYCKEYYNNNKERLQKKARDYGIKNKKEKLQYMKEYQQREEVKQKRKEYMKQWYKDNKEKQSETMKQYRKENAKELSEYEKNRRPNKIERASNNKFRQRTWRWRKTDKGKAHTTRHNHKRKDLGTNELFQNVLEPSENPVSHHVDNDNYVWIPEMSTYLFCLVGIQRDIGKLCYRLSFSFILSMEIIYAKGKM